jgi:hypothetical protein
MKINLEITNDYIIYNNHIIYLEEIKRQIDLNANGRDIHDLGSSYSIIMANVLWCRRHPNEIWEKQKNRIIKYLKILHKLGIIIY